MIVRRMLAIVHWLEDALLASLLALMIFLAVTQIVLRNGFDSGILWADSLLRVLVLWIALIGALVASRNRQHLSVDVITRFLTPSAKRGVSVVTSLFAAGICLLLGWYSLEFVLMEYESATMAFAGVPSWSCESVMPVAFLLIGCRYLLHTAQAALGIEQESGQ